MTAQGIQSFGLGTSNGDESTGFSPDNARTFQRYVGGLEGKVDLFGSAWKWNAYVEHSQTIVSAAVPNDEKEANYTLAINAVINPANGHVVCASTLTNPNNGCVPYNPFGTGVNSQAALNYIQGTAYARVDLEQKNPAGTRAAAISARMNFAREDANDDQLFNRILWATERGERSAMPAPVHAAFVRSMPGGDGDD